MTSATSSRPAGATTRSRRRPRRCAASSGSGSKRQTPIKRKLERTAAGFTRKALHYGVPGRVSAEDLAQIYLEADGHCHFCGVWLNPFYASYDHLTPFERGGDNTIDNIALCCLTDNRLKFTMTEAEYRDWLALERRCKSCGKAFKPRPADYRRGLGFYCSRRCSGRAGGLV